MGMTFWIGRCVTILMVPILSVLLSDRSDAQAERSLLPRSNVAAVYLQPGEDEYSSHVIVEARPLRITTEEWHRLQDRKINPPCGGHDYLPYMIRVSAEGLVEDATLQPYVSWCNDKKSPPDPPVFIRQHLAEARTLLLQARFRPWVINGHATVVIVSSGIEIAPPERYGRFRPFPSPVLQSSVVIAMQRMGCEGKCPAYRVTLRGSGTVEYEGLAFVAVAGKRTAQIDPDAMAELVHQFETARFFSALPEYRGAYDGGETLLQFSVSGTSYSVNDAVGLSVGLPTPIRELEGAINRIPEVRRWVYGPD